MGSAAEDDRVKDKASEDEEDDEHESADGAPEPDAPEAKPTAAATEKRDKPSGAGSKKGARGTKKRSAAGGKGEGSATARRPAPRQGAMAKSMVLFFIIVGALGFFLWYLGRDGGGDAAAPAPKWGKGQKVDVEITLVHTDQNDLACASSDDLAGKHCAFESKGKPWTKTDTKDDKLLLKPYTTTDHIQFLAAGVWSDPGMTKAPLPKTRFSVKCKFLVDGSLRKPAVRWASDGPWYDQGGDWYVGNVSECNVTP